MKGIALSRVFVLIVAALLIMTAGNAADPGFDREPVETFAAEDIVSDTFHSVPWRITSDGELIIGTDGTATKFTELDQTGENPYYFPWNGEEYREKIKSVRFAGTVSTEDWACLSYMFYCLSNCISIDLTNFKVDKIAALNGMFFGCQSLKKVNLKGFTPGGFDRMYDMFGCCESLTSIDLSGIDTSNVESFRGLFEYCWALKSLDLSYFKTTNVTVMDQMFYECRSLEKVDLSSFRTGKLRSMKGMFAGCSSLKTLDLSKFDLSGVSDTANVFDGCGIEILYTPVDLRSGVSIALPYVMHDDKGRQYMSLPAAPVSIRLMKEGVSPDKKANPLKIKVSKKIYKRAKLKKAARFKIGVSKAKGRVKYTRSKAAKSAKIKVTSAGKVTVPKKCKKGRYRITVKAAGNDKYKPGKKTVTIIVK